MIRFQVYSHGKAVQQMSLAGAYLFGQDDIPVRAQLNFADGQLIGLRNSDSAVGLSLLWEVVGFGRISLQTTRLPIRNRPYNLNVEIARSRLLKISQKREEWGMTDLELAEEHHQMIDGALDKFVAALCHLDEPEKAAQYADESLALSMQAGEQMAQFHGEVFLQRRTSTQGFGRHSFGCCIDPQRIKDHAYMNYIKANFHFVTVPVCWREIEPKEQEQNFELLDECVNQLVHNRIAVKVGPLVSFAPAMIPDWLYIWENDFEQVREMAYEFISKVVERYSKKVQAWDVISGLNAHNGFNFSFEQIIEMTRSAALAAKRSSTRSLVLIELVEPWGEYYAMNQRTVPPLIYADMICQSGIVFDGFGLKIRFGQPGSGCRSRDLLELSGLLDRFANFGKQVHLAGLQVPSEAEKQPDKGDKPCEAGCWHGPWSETVQAEWLRNVYRIGLSKPYIDTITWQDLADCETSVMQNGGLLKKDLTPKLAYQQLCELKKELIKPERGKGNQ